MSHRYPLSLFVLKRPSESMFFFVSEPPRPGVGPEEASAGFFARLRYQVHSAYETLRRRFDYGENVCATLRLAESLTMHHPDQVDCRDAERRLKEFLSGNYGKHRKWLIIDSILALFGVLLTPIPGPNVFALYPLVRALSHLFAMRGIRNARSLSEIGCREDPALSKIQLHLGDLDVVAEEVKELEEQYNIHRLRSLLETL